MKLSAEQLDKTISNSFWIQKYAEVLSIEEGREEMLQRVEPGDSSEKVNNLFQNRASRPVVAKQQEDFVKQVFRQKSSIQSPKPGPIPIFKGDPLSAQGSFTGSGVIQGVPYLGLYAQGSFEGSGDTAGSAALWHDGTGEFAGSGELVGGYSIIYRNATGEFTGAGALQGQGFINLQASGQFDGSADLAGSAALWLVGTGQFDGSGAMAGSAALWHGGTGQFVGSGVMAGSAALWLVATGGFDGSGALQGNALFVDDSTAPQWGGITTYQWTAKSLTGSDGDHIVEWEDKINNTFLSQSDGTRYPFITSSGGALDPWVAARFTSSAFPSHFPALSASLAITGSHAIFAAFTIVEKADGGHITFAYPSSEGTDETTLFVAHNDGQGHYYIEGTGILLDTSPDDVTQEDPQFMAGLIDSGDGDKPKLYLTGTETAGAPTAITEKAMATFAIGQSSTSFGGSANAIVDVHEVVLYDSALSSSQKDEVFEYLYDEWFDAETYIANNAVFHLDAQDSGSLWQNTGRTSQVSSDGDPVLAWDDQNNNHDFSNAGSTLNYRTGSLNGYPAVEPGDNDSSDILLSDTFQHGTPCTLFAVYEYAGIGGTEYIGIQGAGGNTRVFFAADAATGTGPGFYDGSSHKAFGATGVTGDVVAAVNFDEDGNAYMYTGSFVPFASGTAYTNINQTEEHRIFGSNPFFSLGEYIWFTGSLEDYKTKRIMTYLKNKWEL